MFIQKASLLKVSTALISVSDKTGLQGLAKELAALGIRIISTGGTAAEIEKAGVKVTKVEDLTGFPEMLDGRVKTLHPKIHAGILAVRKNDEHMKRLEEHGIQAIDLVVINLYPFRKTIAKENVPVAEAIENIDIGGPTLLRAGAKNFESVAVVTSPDQYMQLIAELKKGRGILSEEFRKFLCVKAFEHTASYDVAINAFLAEKFLPEELFPKTLNLSFEKAQDCRYGENPHQKGAFYREFDVKEPCIAMAKQLHGKELSFNNFNDANAAIELVNEFSRPACAIIKHANPCGAAVSDSISHAFDLAYACDKESAFGGIIAVNRKMDPETAQKIAAFFNEIVVAPAFDADALEKLRKKQNLRILEVAGLGEKPAKKSLDFKRVKGGLLVQETDDARPEKGSLKIATKKSPSGQQLDDLLFAATVAKHVKSNAIVFAKNCATVGIGAGQMSRIDATKIASMKAGGNEKGAVMASDAFFPFRDNVDLAAKLGITAILQPGGSVRDEESVKAADEHGIPMVFSGERHFRH